MLARSFRMIFSDVSIWSVACATSNAASDSPPALPRSLWQPMQYCFTVCVAESSAGTAATGAGFALADCADISAEFEPTAKHSATAAEARNAFDILKSIGCPGRWMRGESACYFAAGADGACAVFA